MIQCVKDDQAVYEAELPLADMAFRCELPSGSVSKRRHKVRSNTKSIDSNYRGDFYKTALLKESSSDEL